jgi:hypothetical protein
MLEILSTLGVGTALGTIAGYEYRRKRETTKQQKEEVQAWFDDCLDIIGRGAFNIERAKLRADPDYKRILKSLDEFSERLFVRAKNPPENVPESATNGVTTIAEIYAKSSAVAEARTEKEGGELISELFSMAQDEYSTEKDMAEALSDAMDVSGDFEKLFGQLNKTNFEQDEVADTIEMMLSEWDPDDFGDFLMAVSSDGEDMNLAVDFGMRIFFDLSLELSNTVYDELEKIR